MSEVMFISMVGSMKQRVIHPNVMLQTGKDPDHVKLIVKMRGRDAYYRSLDFFEVDIPIKDIANAILEVQDEC